MPAEPADLAADTAVRPDPGTPGRYLLELPDHWDFLMPSGGVLMTCALRAAAAELGDPTLRLGSASTIFCAPIPFGGLVIDVRVLRRGAATAQVRVALRHGAAPEREAGLEVLATFTRARAGADVLGVAMPTVRSVADALPVDDPAPANPHLRFRFHHQLEERIADGEPTWHPDRVAGPARFARWLRYRVPQRDDAGRLDRLALPPIVDLMPSSLHRAVGPDYRFYAPSLDLTTYVIDDTAREWLLMAVTTKRAKDGWAIGDVDVWDDEGRYLAHGSQGMYLRTVAGVPPVIDASRR